jgi:hypothetical protein
MCVHIYLYSTSAQGWVDEENEGGNGNPFSNLFGGGKKRAKGEEVVKGTGAPKVDDESKEKPKKNGFGLPF